MLMVLRVCCCCLRAVMKIPLLSLVVIAACCLVSGQPVLNFVDSAGYANCNLACKGNDPAWRTYTGKDNRGMCATKDPVKVFGESQGAGSQPSV